MECACTRLHFPAKSKAENNVCHASFLVAEQIRVTNPPCRAAYHPRRSNLELLNTLFTIAAEICHRPGRDHIGYDRNTATVGD